MNYFGRLKGIFGRFFKSFRYDYDPPYAQCSPPISLSRAINDCSQQGKLLILCLTLNGEKVNVPLDFPEEDYIVYSAPFNSRSTFDLARNFQVDSVPFVGLFFCRTKNASDVQLIDKIADVDDYLKVGSHFRRLSRELYDRRDKYVMNEEARLILTDQDQEYNQVLRKAQEMEEIEKKKKEHEEKIKQDKIEKKDRAIRRYNSMPAPPSKGDPQSISVRFMLTGKPTKEREFKMSDEAQLLYDYVSIDYAPNQPVIKYGYPPRALSMQDMDKTLSDLRFAKKETVFVESDDEEEEEEENAE